MTEQRPKHPPSNKDDVIERLICENTQVNGVLEQIRLELRLEGEFEGCSILGGFRAVIKALHKQKDENVKLKAEIRRLENKR